jgi:hypothetical protein
MRAITFCVVYDTACTLVCLLLAWPSLFYFHIFVS